MLISIDDYGTGFSSLGYLRDLHVHALKLDKSFVIDLQTRAENRVIVESTVQMAHALGLQVVAEGVESEWVKDYLLAVGYDLGQGFGSLARCRPRNPELGHEVQRGGTGRLTAVRAALRSAQ